MSLLSIVLLAIVTNSSLEYAILWIFSSELALIVWLSSGTIYLLGVHAVKWPFRILVYWISLGIILWIWSVGGGLGGLFTPVPGWFLSPVPLGTGIPTQ